ncbi:MAG: hypothetical protein MJE68_22470 [Proteobacteria bacterium]|nr:hypothetical protein [Pseudomonadota bacterium]
MCDSEIGHEQQEGGVTWWLAVSSGGGERTDGSVIQYFARSDGRGADRS